MAQRAIGWISTKLRRTDAVEPQVHFHQGPDRAPAVCHDDGCSLPHLSV